MNTGTAIINLSQFSRFGVNRHILRDGSSVNVKVLADKGNGQYLGTVAGARVNIHSSKPLAVGSSFSATVSVKDGDIVITPKQNDTQIELSKTVGNSSASEILISLGIEPDLLSSNIIRQMKQIGMKLDASLLNRIKNLSIKFGNGREKKAAEVLMMLAERGVDFEESDVVSLLAMLEEYDGDFCNFDKKNRDSENWKKILNKINKVRGSWFIFPFELVRYSDSQVVGNVGKGCIRILMSKLETLKMINLSYTPQFKKKDSYDSCEQKNQKYLFNLNYKNKKCTGIKFCVCEIGGKSKTGSENQAYLSEKFSKCLCKVGIFCPVEWENEETIEGFAAETEEFYSFGGDF